MISGIFRGVAPFAFVLLIAGCDPEGYPADLKYPVRSDVIILTQNPDEPFHPEPPGHLEISIATYNKLKADGKDVKALDPTLLSGKERADLGAALEKHFGTPAKPLVKIDASDDEDVDNDLKAAFSAAELQLDDKVLAAGSVLYRRHCQHCHGVSGNGRGPTAAWLHPHPRDYRKGKFKFISTGSTRSIPSRNDLYRVLKNGIDYTSMPSFALLPDDELDQLISYVIHLSLRGQAEEQTITAALSKKLQNADNEDVGIDVYLQSRVRSVVVPPKDRKGISDGWKEMNAAVLTPKVGPSEDQKKRDADIEKGYKFFIGDAGCLKCHKDFGRQSLYRYDTWGTLVQPRNLTAGLYRGGRRPIDFFWRIRNGIDPSTMPSIDVLLNEDQKKEIAELKKSKGNDEDPAVKKRIAELTEPNIWLVVAFIQAVPYPNMLPESVRKEVYPAPPPAGTGSRGADNLRAPNMQGD